MMHCSSYLFFALASALTTVGRGALLRAGTEGAGRRSLLRHDESSASAPSSTQHPAEENSTSGPYFVPLVNISELDGKAALQSFANTTALHSSNASSLRGGQQKGVTRPPRVFFLFMAVDKVSNLGVWNQFFAEGDPSLYRVLIHCKLPSCIEYVAGTVFQAVPTVPSYYCTDLVSPMNQLLGHALNNDPGSENPADKFVFISDSTLPAKPFSQVYSTLSTRQGSDFCAFPSNEWADIPGSQGSGLEVAVKVHQWIALERIHAVNACIMWSQGRLHNLMQKFWMNANAYTWNNNSYADNRNFGCLDEFWHMAALYGTLHHVDASRDAVVSLQLFTNTPLRVSKSTGWQGACDTFVMWNKYLHAPGNNPFAALHSALDPASIPHGGNDQRPGWWDTISSYGIHAIRNSHFLFVRKFIDNPRLANGGNFGKEYGRIVLGH